MLYYTVVVDKGGDVMGFQDCRVNRATFASSQGSPDLTCSLEFIGSQRDTSITAVTGGLTSPSGIIAQHYELTTCDITIPAGSQSLNPLELQLVINHNLVADIYRNSRNRLAIPQGMREITGVVVVDWSEDVVALLDSWRNDEDATIDFQYSDGTITFDGQAALATTRQTTSQVTFSHDTDPKYLVDSLVGSGVGLGYRDKVTIGGSAVTTATVDNSGANEAPVTYQRTDLLMNASTQASVLADFYADLWGHRNPAPQIGTGARHGRVRRHVQQPSVPPPAT